MKRPQTLGSPKKPRKKPRTKRIPKTDPLADLRDRLERAELEATFNTRTDEQSLDELFVLLVDMIAAVAVHGTEADDAFAKVEPETAWKDYLRMWREQHLKLEQVLHRYVTDPDEVFCHADAVATELERRERLAWRVWLCRRVMDGQLTDEGLRGYLETFRVTGSGPKGRPA